MSRSLVISRIETLTQFIRPTAFTFAASIALGVLTCFVLVGQVDAQDWVRFRGPNGAGVSKTAAPVNWSPAVANETMFLFSRGLVTRLDANTGEQIEKERLPAAASTPTQSGGGGRGGRGNSDYSSPVVAGNKLYYVRASGETLVFTTDAGFENVASNRVTDEDEQFNATPAICNGQIILRSNKSLYCVEEK